MSQRGYSECSGCGLMFADASRIDQFVREFHDCTQEMANDEGESSPYLAAIYDLAVGLSLKEIASLLASADNDDVRAAIEREISERIAENA